MPVTRYRDVGEMPGPPRIVGDDLAERIRAVWNRAVKLAKLSPRPDVTKYRSVEEAQEARVHETAERLRRMRRERSQPSAT